ncbi:hypothetical protein [Thiothrix subterranea]|uniref:Uncharacterized protein n=1 Tax=Thiothrix subterranea TaxID=2735563 RepID=A0AA51MLB8_9GAMM|nr:hypothetical protein [Thiothrix subterranea]MDQ5767912.1 hypothetical protein [Thiothrix subterranea]WML86629.1 hypothetical protein RCG00_20380 [Thiothrix subterranea]
MGIEGRGLTRKGLGNVPVMILAALDWLVDADIRSFFDQIPQTPLKKKLKGFVDDKALLRIMDLWLKQGAHHNQLAGE